MIEDRIELHEERPNDSMLQDQGIWDEIMLLADKVVADDFEEDAQVRAMKPGDDGEHTIS